MTISTEQIIEKLTGLRDAIGDGSTALLLDEAIRRMGISQMNEQNEMSAAAAEVVRPEGNAPEHDAVFEKRSAAARKAVQTRQQRKAAATAELAVRTEKRRAAARKAVETRQQRKAAGLSA